MTVQDNFPATGMPDRDRGQALWPEPAKTLDALGLHTGLAVVSHHPQ